MNYIILLTTVILAATIGATTAYLISQSLHKEKINRMLVKQSKRYKQLLEIE